MLRSLNRRVAATTLETCRRARWSNAPPAAGVVPDRGDRRLARAYLTSVEDGRKVREDHEYFYHEDSEPAKG
jgi:hypothetical protein